MQVMSKSILYYKQPLNKKGRPYLIDGRWSLPQQKQLIPRMKKKSLNPIKIKQIYEFKIKDQLLLQRQKHQHTEYSEGNMSELTETNNRSQSTQVQPRELITKTSNFRIRNKSITNGLFIKMGNRAKYDMKYMNNRTHSWMKL